MKKLKAAIISMTIATASLMLTGCQEEAENDDRTGNEQPQISSFSDIGDHWAIEEINDLLEKELVSGYPDGTFKPENPITREEAAQIMSNYAGVVATDVEVPEDSRDRWSTPAIQNLLGQELISGYPDGTFRPTNDITRSEFSSMVYNALYRNNKLDPSIVAQFRDLTGHWSEMPVETLSGNGMIKGYPDGTFMPEKSITRGEASAIISRAMKDYMNSTVYYLKDSGTEVYLVREVHRVEKSIAVARAALNEIISGTVLTPEAFRVIPLETEILGIDIEDGLATVDFSEEVLDANLGAEAETLGIASIVNTLTEFPTVEEVAFTVEGSAENGMDWWGHVGLYDQPFSRDIGKVYEPVIWVNSPIANEIISNPLQTKGNARVFEATVNFRLRDADGTVLDEGFAMASSGAPERGDFTGTLEFDDMESGSGQLEVFEISAKDGDEINKVIVPVSW